MVGGGGDRREACVSIGARRGGEKRKATQSKITAAALRGQSLALCLCRLVAKHIYQFATKAVSAFEKPTVFQKPCRGRRGSTRSVREHRSPRWGREAQGNPIKNHRGPLLGDAKSKKNKKTAQISFASCLFIIFAVIFEAVFLTIAGRGGGGRTRDFLLPKQTR